MIAMLAAFVLTCRANAQSKAGGEDDDNQVKGTGKIFDDLNSTDISVEDENSSERGMKKSNRVNKSD